MAKLLFKWTDNSLIAANTGHRFTKGGLEALCSSRLSDKGGGGFETEEAARIAINDIQKRELTVYASSPTRVIQDARDETQTGRDYTNRLLLELMQNADDAAATVAIGYKGLGFKSVLDVCEAARIYSGHMHVRFARTDSCKALEEADIPFQNEVPVLRLPFWNDSDSDTDAVALLGQYDTVIVLPWKNGIVPHLFEDEWNAVRGDATVLLLLHALEDVIWQGPKGDRVEWRCGRHENEITLSVSNSTGDREDSRWRIFRHADGDRRSSVVVRLDEAGEPIPYRHDKLRVFFPTEEQSPLPLILHGEFDLEQNRKRVRPDDTRPGIIQSLATSVKQTLAKLIDDGRFLDLLRPRIPVENMTGLEREIWDAIRSEAQDIKLPASGVRLSEVRLRPTEQLLSTWKSFKELLGMHRPGGLTGLNVLLPETDTEEREKTVSAFNPKSHLSVADLRRAALFPVAGHDAPVAADDFSLFFPQKDGRSADALSSMPIAFIREGFAVKCKEQAPVCQFLEKLGVTEFSPVAIAAALARSDLNAVPHESLWQFLLLTVAPLLKDEDAIMDWQNKDREILAKQVKVPCRDTDWAPAINVYAGQEWTGHDFLECAFESQRSYLIAPPANEEQRKRIEQLSRWLGVGWSPKVLPIVNFKKKSETKEGPKWQNEHFPVENAPSLWRQHNNALYEIYKAQQNFRSYSTRLRQDWTIDGDAEVLRIEGAFDNIFKEWRAYAKYLSAVIYRTSNMAQDYDNVQLRRPRVPSYLLHLFKHIEWITTQGSGLLKAANDVFIKDGEVQHALAGWVFTPVAGVPPEVAKGMGIRRDWSEINIYDWKRWIDRSLGLNPQTNPDHQKLITTLYQHALRRFGERYDEREQQLWQKDIWCEERRPDNTTIWHRESNPNKIYYVDRPDLARLRLPEVKLFPVMLGWKGNLERVRQLFEVHPLSHHLRGDVAFGAGEIGALVGRLHDRLRERWKCLAAYLRVKGVDSCAAREKWDKMEFKVGRNLQVTFCLNDQVQSSRNLPAFFQVATKQTPVTLWLDADENFTETRLPRDIAWEEVGSALCYAAGLPLEDGTLFTGLLSCGGDSLKRKLLNLGVTEADIEAFLPRTVLQKGLEPTPTPSQPSTPTPHSQTEVTHMTGTDRTGGHRAAGEAMGTGGHSGGGGGGESDQHRQLKQRLAEQPELIEAGFCSAQTEYQFKSGDRADIVCEDASGNPVAVEVESYIASGNEVGLWQAVKYKHLLAAERNLKCSQVRAFLIAPKIPEDVKSKCASLGIEPKEISGKPL